MESFDEMMQNVLSIDTDSVSDNNNGKASFPEYPGEKPKKSDLVKWLDIWYDALVTSGYGASLRGETPYQYAKLAPKPLLPVPAASAENASRVLAIELENARLTNQNDNNAIELAGRLLENQNAVAAKIKAAMRDKAPVKLAKLLAAHPAKTSSGTVIDNAYNGFDMFAALEMERTGEVRREALSARVRGHARLAA